MSIWLKGKSKGERGMRNVSWRGGLWLHSAGLRRKMGSPKWENSARGERVRFMFKKIMRLLVVCRMDSRGEGNQNGREPDAGRAVGRPKHYCPGRGDCDRNWKGSSADEEKWKVQGTFQGEHTRTPWCSVAACGDPLDTVHSIGAEPDPQHLSYRTMAA